MKSWGFAGVLMFLASTGTACSASGAGGGTPQTVIVITSTSAPTSVASTTTTIPSARFDRLACAYYEAVVRAGFTHRRVSTAEFTKAVHQFSSAENDTLRVEGAALAKDFASNNRPGMAFLINAVIATCRSIGVR